MAIPFPRPVVRLGRIILDIVLPPRCPGCGAQVDADHRFCADCWRSLDFLDDPGDDAAARAAVAYGDVARAVALKLKYGRRPGAARTMAALMERLVADCPADALFAAVPLHRVRLWGRGYNQALLIARALTQRSGHACVPDLIVRTRATPALRGMGRAERARTVQGAFAVPRRHAAMLAGRTVVLIDDVHTTGATVDACAAVLRAAGAASVRVACWARVVRPEARDR